MKIINTTTLNYQTIGLMMDKIIESSQGDTIYYGKIEFCRMSVGNRTINVQIRYLKRYVEWYFSEV
jgi:hypothetical protein